MWIPCLRCFNQVAPEDDPFTQRILNRYNLGGIELLEATGQGVHIYNMAVRMFFGFNATRTGTVAVRRLKRVKLDSQKVDAFVNKVRGKLYHVQQLAEAALAKNELDSYYDSFFCSQLCVKFLRDMGLLAADAGKDFEYSPSHFGSGSVPLAPGLEWGELELVRDEWASRPLPLASPHQSKAPKALTSGSRIATSRL